MLRNDASYASAADALAQSVAAAGGLDGLWLNAGYAAVAGVDEIDADFFDRMNVRGPVLQLARLSEQLGDGASRVVTSSMSTYEAAMASVCAATKGALVAMERGWATELAGRGIRVNVLVPGAISTSFRDFMSEDVRADFEADVVGRVPIGRIGTADEAAAVALFLLSDVPRISPPASMPSTAASPSGRNPRSGLVGTATPDRVIDRLKTRVGVDRLSALGRVAAMDQCWAR